MSNAAEKNAAEKLADAVIETYFQLQDEPLPGWGRFLCAWAGAATLFGGSMFILKTGPIILVESSSIWTVFWTVVVAPSLPGFLIAAARTRHGPVRLYISGMLLSSFIVAVVLKMWKPS